MTSEGNRLPVPNAARGEAQRNGGIVGRTRIMQVHGDQGPPVAKARSLSSLAFTVWTMGNARQSWPTSGTDAYSYVKGAPNTFMRCAAVEYAPHGIRLNALQADMLEGPRAGRWRRSGMPDGLLLEIPLGKATEPSEFVKMIVWLATVAVSITGSTIDGDNGGHLRR